MTIEDAQREVRSVYLGGFPGFLVSGVLWAVSAAIGMWSSRRVAILILIVGGALIHPLARLVLRTMGKHPALSRENPMRQLATQAGLVIPATLPLVAAAALRNVNWFYPALMVSVGAHYFPFVFLYGMRQYFWLGGVLIVARIATARIAPMSFTAGGWIAATLFLIAAAAFAKKLSPRRRCETYGHNWRHESRRFRSRVHPLD